MSVEKARKFKIFISCRPADRVIASEIENAMQSVANDTLEIFRSTDTHSNLDRSTQESIDGADLMVAIITGEDQDQAWTFFEMGLFEGSLDREPLISFLQNANRRLIPFAIHRRTPEILWKHPGVELDAESWRYSQATVKENAGSGEQIKQFLRYIEGLVGEAAAGRLSKSISSTRIDEITSDLHKALLQEMGQRIRTETVATTLIVRVQPNSGAMTSDKLHESTISLRGYSEAFGADQDDGFITWSDFLERASGRAIAQAWQDAFYSLLRTEFLGSETIPSFDGLKVVRLFVTRVVSFFNGMEEYHFYVLPERVAPKVSASKAKPAAANSLTYTQHSKSELTRSRSSSPVHIFISYKHADYRVVDDLRNHLGWLENAKDITVFDDRAIEAGEDWNRRILSELKRAQIIVLLVSAAFMRSPYCTKVELQEALNFRSIAGIQVVPIIVETCLWEEMPLRSIAALPKDKANNLKPLNKWGRDRDVALTQIARQIKQHVERLSSGLA